MAAVGTILKIFSIKLRGLDFLAASRHGTYINAYVAGYDKCYTVSYF